MSKEKLNTRAAGVVALAVMLRVKAFEAPDKAPAIYDQEEDEEPTGDGRKEKAREKDWQKKKKRRG